MSTKYSVFCRCILLKHHQLWRRCYQEEVVKTSKGTLASRALSPIPSGSSFENKSKAGCVIPNNLSSLGKLYTTYTKVNLQKDGGGGGNEEDGEVKPKTKEISSEEGEYDPKQDSFFTQDNAFGSKENKGQGDPERPVFIPEETKGSSEEEELTPPTNCCMSGCPNCVWIDYVEKLSKKYSDPKMGREQILKALDELDDQNIKAFIMMELRTKKLI